MADDTTHMHFDKNTTKRLERIERRVSRLRDIKWFIGLLVLILVGVIGLAQWNFSSEKTRLEHSSETLRTDLTASIENARTQLKAETARDFDNERSLREKFETDVNALLGKIGEPELKVLHSKGEPLAGQEITVNMVRRPPQPDNWYTLTTDPYRQWQIEVPIIIQNTSKTPSGQASLKLYSKRPLKIGKYRSADESEYDYEDYIIPQNLPDIGIPGNATVTITLTSLLSEFPPPGSYQVLLKLYYGQGKAFPVSFYMIVEQHEPPRSSSRR